MRGRISQESVDSLIPGARDLFLWDDALPGFGVKITPKGRRVYVYQYRMGGRGTPTARVTIGADGAPWDAARARDEAERLSVRVEAGKDPRSHKAAPMARAGGGGDPALDAADWRIRLGFLVTDITRLQQTTLRRTIKALGGSPAQSRLLGELSLSQGMSQTELATALGLSKVAVGGLVDRAARAGWVEKRLDPKDRRTRRLHLTSVARRAFAAMRTEVDTMNDTIYEYIDAEEGARTMASLEALRLGWLNVAKKEGAAG